MFPTYERERRGRKLKEKIEKEFNLLSGNIMVLPDMHQIFVWARLQDGGYWTGSPCGVIRGQSALDTCVASAMHLVEHRELLPKACREFDILPVIFY